MIDTVCEFFITLFSKIDIFLNKRKFLKFTNKFKKDFTISVKKKYEKDFSSNFLVYAYDGLIKIDRFDFNDNTVRLVKGNEFMAWVSFKKLEKFSREIKLNL